MTPASAPAPAPDAPATPATPDDLSSSLSWHPLTVRTRAAVAATAAACLERIRVRMMV
ncbi:hypothetical protein [Streptomyces sp. NPDC058268]|uniref:hypothetical protein n=1 Tax=Streptomyces sp. NPDC058268 TaxID=3346413 RepID=UPI0036E255A3